MLSSDGLGVTMQDDLWQDPSSARKQQKQVEEQKTDIFVLETFNTGYRIFTAITQDHMEGEYGRVAREDRIPLTYMTHME